MTIMIDQKLAKLAKALGKLPDDAVADVLGEIEARVESLAHGRMTGEQRDLVRARMDAAREYASAEDVAAVLDRYQHPS